MRAVVYEEYGQPEVLRLQNVDTPALDADEVLVDVRGTSVNPGDWFWLQGIPYLFRPVIGISKPKNNVLGIAISGTVEETHSTVTDFEVGDEVYAEVTGGGFAEYVAVPTAVLARKPANLPFEQAASVPVVGTTALQALRDVGNVGPGDKVLINGASGGVGTFAVQIGKWLGAEVTGVCSGSNVELVRSLGADHVVDYTEADFTEGGPYDVIVDNQANRSLGDLRRALAPKGRLILNSGSGSRWFGPLGLMIRGILTSPFVGQKIGPFLNRPNRDDLDALTDLIEAGTVAPVIDSSFSLDETAAALARYGTGRSAGKVVITVAESDGG